MKNSIKTLVLAAAIAASGFGGVAWAHQGGAMGGMGMHGMGMQGMGKHGMDMGRHGAEQPGMQGMGSAADVTTRLSALKAELKITAAQETAWQGYEGVLTQHAQARQAMRQAMQALMHDPKASGEVDHAAHHQAMDKVRTAHQAEQLAARQALNAVLSPEQKSLLEQRSSSAQHMAGGRGHGHGHGNGHANGQAMGPGKGEHRHGQ